MASISNPENENPIHNLFVISAPSGAGKTSLIKALCSSNSEIKVSVSHTTRMPRQGEIAGIDYFFITVEQFEQMLKEEKFLEYAKVYDNYYGTSKEELEKLMQQNCDVILEVDLQGAVAIKKLIPNAIFIFILPPSLDELAKRLKTRSSESPKSLQNRLEAAQDEIAQSKIFDYAIINESFNTALEDLYSIIRACRLNINKTIANIKPSKLLQLEN